MKNIVGMVTAVFAVFLGTSAASQESGWTGELNFAEVAEVSGVEIGVGYYFRSGQFRVTPILGGFVYQGELVGFQSESGGICRDLSNGQFSESENCDATEIEGYGKLEANIALDAFEIGFGYRTSDRSDDLYGMLGARVGPNGAIRVNVGEEYVALSLSFSQ